MSYDPKAVKVSKAIKQLASTCANKVDRKQLIRDFVKVLESNNTARASRNTTKKK